MAQVKNSKHFESLQIFTAYSEPMLDEFITRKDQMSLEKKHHDEEDKLYRKFLAQRREDEDRVTQMEKHVREDYLNQRTKDERSKAVSLALRQCRQMVDSIYKKKVEYFKQGGENEDWKKDVDKTYPRDPPAPSTAPYTKKQIYENNTSVFQQIDDSAIKATDIDYTSFTNLVRDLVGRSSSDVEKVRALFRYMSDKKFNFRSWFLYYPEEGNTRGVPEELFRGVEFGIESKALLFKRLCAYAGLHCEIIKGFSKSGPYLPGEEFLDNSYRNTWNAVFIAGGWRLVQSNWAMVSLHSKVSRETRQLYQDHYFLTDPDKFIFEFFPMNSDWQLMNRPITIEEFEDLPLLRSTFFHFGLGLDGNPAAVMDCDERGELSIKLVGPPEISYHYEISFLNLETRLLIWKTTELCHWIDLS
ncbi:hillarin [Lepeophtheirus salmonis]|uniref:hillarin n=1 Tax=Lepeophtheirus salmonis TaxID=72036 RepID=UPI003AF3EA17